MTVLFVKKVYDRRGNSRPAPYPEHAAAARPLPTPSGSARIGQPQGGRLPAAALGLGAYLCLSAVPGNRADAAKFVFDSLNRIDGVKMLFMAVFAFAGFRVLHNGKAHLPAWLAWVALALAVTIFLSAIGFLFLLDSFSSATYVSLPLLMLWVTAVGVVLARSGHLPSGDKQG